MRTERKANRLQGFDYKKEGYYFVTVCTHNREDWFGEIINGQMKLNQNGDLVEHQWAWLAEQYRYVQLDFFVVMPNHIHGILSIVGGGRDRPLQKIKSLSGLMGAFKTTSSKSIHKAGSMRFRWQRSFHDRIIRDEKDLNRIRQYIVDNPIRWEEDRNNFQKDI